MPTIRLDHDVFEGLQKLAQPFVDSPGMVIRRLLEEQGVLQARRRKTRTPRLARRAHAAVDLRSLPALVLLEGIRRPGPQARCHPRHRQADDEGRPHRRRGPGTGQHRRDQGREHDHLGAQRAQAARLHQPGCAQGDLGIDPAGEKRSKRCHGPEACARRSSLRLNDRVRGLRMPLNRRPESKEWRSDW